MLAFNLPKVLIEERGGLTILSNLDSVLETDLFESVLAHGHLFLVRDQVVIRNSGKVTRTGVEATLDGFAKTHTLVRFHPTRLASGLVSACAAQLRAWGVRIGAGADATPVSRASRTFTFHWRVTLLRAALRNMHTCPMDRCAPCITGKSSPIPGADVAACVKSYYPGVARVRQVNVQTGAVGQNDI